jgi:adenine-specific DNA glycosylase
MQQKNERERATMIENQDEEIRIIKSANENLIAEINRMKDIIVKNEQEQIALETTKQEEIHSFKATVDTLRNESEVLKKTINDAEVYYIHNFPITHSDRQD